MFPFKYMFMQVQDGEQSRYEELKDIGQILKMQVYTVYLSFSKNLLLGNEQVKSSKLAGHDLISTTRSFADGMRPSDAVSNVNSMFNQFSNLRTPREEVTYTMYSSFPTERQPFRAKKSSINIKKEHTLLN